MDTADIKRGALASLLGYTRGQREIIEKILNELKGVDPIGPEKVVYTGYLLHNLYCAFEDIFQEVAKTFENTVEDISQYHRELLKKMRMEVPRVRPRILSDASYTILDELRGFRHIFRHSYDYELSQNKVEDLKARVFSHRESIESDLGAFEDFLEKALPP